MLRHSVEDITASSHHEKLILWGSDIQDNFSRFVPTLVILWQHTRINFRTLKENTPDPAGTQVNKLDLGRRIFHLEYSLNAGRITHKQQCNAHTHTIAIRCGTNFRFSASQCKWGWGESALSLFIPSLLSLHSPHQKGSTMVGMWMNNLLHANLFHSVSFPVQELQRFVAHCLQLWQRCAIPMLLENTDGKNSACNLLPSMGPGFHLLHFADEEEFTAPNQMLI